MATEHSSISDADRHEAKGASTATNNQVLTADGDGTTSFRQPTIVGWYNYDNDGPVIPLTLAATYYDLTNDASGSQTFNYKKLPGVDSVWNPATNRFNWVGLDIGDLVSIRIDVIVNVGAVNTALDLTYEIGIGSATNINIPITTQRDFKSTGSYQITFEVNSFIGSLDIKNSPARIKARVDKTGTTITNNGWFVTVTKPGMYT